MKTGVSRRLTAVTLMVGAAAGEVLGLLGVPQGAAAEPGPGVSIAKVAPASVRSMPKAQAFDGNKLLPSVEEVTKLCRQGNRCTFTPEGESEYRNGVISVGNSFLNCSDHDVSISRNITLHPAVTDNIGGQILGTSTTTGGIGSTSQVGLSGDAETDETIKGTTQTWAPNIGSATQSSTNEGDTLGKLSGTISGSSTGSQTTQQSFGMQGGRNYGRTWQTTIDSGFTANVIAPAGDVLTLGFMDVGKRVRGTLNVTGTSKYVKNVVVDEPSIMESSSFVVQTYTAPKGACLNTRPTT
ncbi:hypothetical protein [Streptomyces sp. NPDC007205]|uniref:hypothetical protein n=1 Tax=Streptomyces sp. NPDC007205 TaxID=3154316 RepID=UPI0033E60AB8